MPPPVRHTLLALLAFLTACTSPRSAPLPGPVLALTGGTVIDVERGRLLPERTVLIAGGRIVAAGPSARVTVPDGARVLDIRGKFVIPGLWDMHVHAFDPALEGPLFLAFGVTGVRQMAGLPVLLARRDSLRAGAVTGPRMVLASPMLDGPNPLWRQIPDYTIAVGSAAEGTRAVDFVHDRGWELVKVYTKLPAEAFFAVAARARALGMPVVGHVPDLVNAADAAEAGMRTLEHDAGLDLACSAREDELRDTLRAALATAPGWDQYGPVQQRVTEQAQASRDPARCARLYARLARSGAYWTPTLALMQGGALMGDSAVLDRVPMQWVRPRTWWRQNLRAVPAPERAAREQEAARRRAMFGEMHRAGVPLLAGTDSGNPNLVAGWSLHEELALLVDAGLAPLDALRAATLTPARALRMTDSLGTVRRGAVADLVVLDANPLENIRATRQIHAVVAAGRLITAADREALLAQATSLAAPRTPPAQTP